MWLLVAGINALFKLTSQLKYKIALIAQFGAFVWFVVSLQYYYGRCSEALAMLQSSGLNSSNAFVFHTDTHNFSSILLTIISKSEKFLPYLSVAYLCLLGVLALRWVKGYRQTTFIKTRGLQKIDVEWRLFVKRISEMLNIKHNVSIYLSEIIKSPLTVGFLKPLILIPIASLNNLTTYQLEAIILHELAHIKRADYVINIIQSIIEIGLFFNPFIQLLGKIIKRERENSCDDWVLQFQYNPSDYAEALLRIAYMQQAPAFAMNAAGKEKDLLWRVKRMLNQKQKSFQYRNRLLALLLITGMLSSVAWFTPGVKTAAIKSAANVQQPVVMEPLAIKIDNPLFNPLSFLNKPFKEEVNKAAEDAAEGLQEATTAIANKVVTNVVPGTLAKIQTISADLPAIISNGSKAAQAALDQLKRQNISQLVNQYTNSDSLNELVTIATNQLKNIEWSAINKGLKSAGTEIEKNVDDKDLTVYGLNLKNLITTSLNSAAKSIPQIKLAASDNNDNDGEATMSSGGATLTLRQQAAKPVQGRPATGTGAHQKVNEVKNRVDSTIRVYGINRVRGLNKTNLSGDAVMQYYATAANTGVNYLAPQAAAITYTPAKFDQSGNSYSWNSNGLSVTPAANTTLIAVKEEKDDCDTYKKNLTIETMDSTGQKHTFHVIVEVYQ